MRVAAAVLAIAVVASGCASADSAAEGSTAAGSSAPTGSGLAVGVGTASVASAAPPRSVTALPPGPAPVLGAGAVLTGADRSATVRLRVGQRVRVLLGGDQPFAWAPVRTSLPKVAEVIGAVDRQPRLTVRAVVLARSPGRAELTASADAPCFHTRPPCLAAVRDWNVAVVVRP